MENQKAPSHGLGTSLEVIGYASASVCVVTIVFMVMSLSSAGSSANNWITAVAGFVAALMIAGLGVIINTLTRILHRLPAPESRKAERESVEAMGA